MFREFAGYFLRRPRFSWMIVILLSWWGLWVYWNGAMSQKVEVLRGDLRARGWPAVHSDFQNWAAGSKENVWKLYLEAGKIINDMDSEVESPRCSNETFPEGEEHGAKWMAMAQASNKAFTRAFELAQRASERMGFVEGVPDLFQKSPKRLDRPGLNGAKSLANVLADDAEYMHFTGNSAMAMERIAQGLCLAKTVGNRSSDELPLLVSNGINALTASSANQIAPTLKKEDLPKTRTKIAQVIQLLLNESGRQKDLQAAFAGNRACKLRIVHAAYSKSVVGEPMALAFEFQSWRRLKEMLDHIDGEKWETELQKWDYPQPQPDLSGNTVDEEFDLYPQLTTSVVGSYYRCVVETRISAISLAWQLYRMDHDGQAPKTLDELVPVYLPFVPMDPFMDYRKPIGYWPDKYKTPDGAPRPVLFYGKKTDIGPNPTKPIYEVELKRAKPSGGVYRDIREYRDLTSFKPVVLPRPAERFDHQPDKANEAGDEQQPE